MSEASMEAGAPAAELSRGEKRALRKERKKQAKIDEFKQRLRMRGGDVEALARFKAFIANEAKKPNSELQKILKRKDFLDYLKTCGIEKDKDYYSHITRNRFATLLERTNPARIKEMKELREDVVDRIKKGKYTELFINAGKYSNDIADMIVLIVSRIYPDEFFKLMIQSAVDAEKEEGVKKGVELGQLAATLYIQQTFRIDEKEAHGEALIPEEVAKKVEILGRIGKRYAVDYINLEFDKLGDLVDLDDKINASMGCDKALESETPSLSYQGPVNEKIKRVLERIDYLKKRKETLENDETSHKTQVRIEAALEEIKGKAELEKETVDKELDSLKAEIENKLEKLDDTLYERSVGVGYTELDEEEAGLDVYEQYEIRLYSLLKGMIDNVKSNKELDYQEKRRKIAEEGVSDVKLLELAFQTAVKKLDRKRFDAETCLEYLEEQNLEFNELAGLQEQMKADEELMGEYSKVKPIIAGEKDEDGSKTGGVVFYLERYAQNLEHITSEDIKNDIRKIEKKIPGEIDEKEIMGMEDKGVIEEDRKRIKNAAVCLVWMNRYLKDIQRTTIGQVKEIVHNDGLGMREKILALDRYDLALETRMKESKRRYEEVIKGLDLNSQEKEILDKALEKKNMLILFDERRPESLKFMELLSEKDAFKLLEEEFKIESEDIVYNIDGKSARKAKKQKETRDMIGRNLDGRIQGAIIRYKRKRHPLKEFEDEDGKKMERRVKELKYESINEFETEMKSAIESEKKLKPEKKAYLMLLTSVIRTNEEKRLDIEIARKTAPIMDQPPSLFVNDYLAASKTYLGGVIKKDNFDEMGKDKVGLLKRYYIGELFDKNKDKFKEGLKESLKDVLPFAFWGESTKSFPTMKRAGKAAAIYIIGGLAALNLYALLAGQPKRPPFEHGETTAAQIWKSAIWHAAYPGGKLNDWFTSKKAEERMDGEIYSSNEPTRVVWDGKKFYFEIDGKQKDLGEVSKVTPGVWLKPKNPGQSWETDDYGYYKSAYFGNSQAEPGSDVLKWIDNRPEVLRFLEEVGMKHQWVQELVERDPEIADGMIENGWQEKSRTEDGKVMLERWLLVQYEGDYVLNSEKTSDFIKYLMGKEVDGEKITYKWLDERRDALKEEGYLIPKVMSGYMTTFNLTTDEAKWILSDSGTGKQTSSLLDELLAGKQIGDRTYMLDGREVGKAIKKLYELKFSETTDYTEENILDVLKAEGHIGDSSDRPLVDRFGLTYANASWVSERPELLELLYHLKAERVKDMDQNRYGLEDANAFIDYLKNDKAVIDGAEINTSILGYSMPGYASMGHIKKVSDRAYLGVTQDEKWEWLQNHQDIKNVLESLRTGLEANNRIYYLSPENLQTDRLLQELMDREYQQNKKSKKEQKITSKYLMDNLESYRRQEYLLGKYTDYPENAAPIKGVKSNLGWMLHFGIQEPHANDVIYTPEIRATFDELYKNKSGEIYKTFKELYKSSDDTRVKAIWSKNYQLVFYEVGYYIANKNKDSGAGIECEAITGQCKFMEGGAEENKKKLESVTVAIIKQMKQRKQLNDKITTAELESAKEPVEELPEGTEAVEGEVSEGGEAVTVNPPEAPVKDEETAEEDKPAVKKVKKAKKGGKKKGGKKKASSSVGAGGI